MSALVRVLHIVNGDLYSGAERVQDLLALGLGEFGYDVGFVSLKAGLFAAKRKAVDAPLYTVAMRHKADLACAWQIAAIVKREGYRLVHTHTPRSALVGRPAAALAGVPMVHHVHSPTARDTEAALRNRVNAGIERLSLLGVPALIPVSDSLAGYLRGLGYADKRISPVPNGVPTPATLPARATPSASWTVGMVALFRPRKGIEVLLQALAILRDQGAPVRLLAVGPFESPAYQTEILALCQRLKLDGLIEWTGFTTDVATQFQRMDLFVLPSLYGEGMPMVVLEAMAQGIPVVASRVEGIPEVIGHGQSGLVVPASDPAALAQAVADLTEGRYDWQLMRSAAREVQQSRFSARSMARGVAAVYDQVLGTARTPA